MTIGKRKVYVETGDGRWWASDWPSGDVQPTWELLEGIKPRMAKPEEIGGIEIVPGINIYFVKDVGNGEQ